jgi:hypothetical protein
LVLASCSQHKRKSYKENDKPSHREPPNQGIATITARAASPFPGPPDAK